MKTPLKGVKHWHSKVHAYAAGGFVGSASKAAAQIAFAPSYRDYMKDMQKADSSSNTNKADVPLPPERPADLDSLKSED